MDRLEYLNQISEGYGARVQIHDRDTYPYPGEGGIFVPTASETNIGIRMVRYIIILKSQLQCLNISHCSCYHIRSQIQCVLFLIVVHGFCLA